MLSHLSINNIAIIDSAAVDFTSGFNVLTGETAAGKSIVIDSINMVLGERTSRGLIRHGEKKAVVEALFQVEGSTVVSHLESLGIEAEDNSLLLRREIFEDGKNTCRANGQLVTTSMLKEISKILVNIHGQHDSQQLLSPSKHIEFLDSYSKLFQEISNYFKLFEENKNLKEQLNKLRVDEAEKLRRLDILAFQIDEIEKSELISGEEEELIEKRNFLLNIEKINHAIRFSYDKLYSSEASVYDGLALVKRELESVISYDKQLDEFYQSIEEISISLEDIVHQLRSLNNAEEHSSDALYKVEARLDLIQELKRKYGNSIDEIHSFLKQSKEEFSQITYSEKLQKQLENQLKTNQENLRKSAQILTKRRTEAARELEKKIMRELAELEMEKAKFSVSIQPCEYNKDGADKIEFLISTNAGEPLKPLAKVASGGELSRIMLAIKSILADSDMVGTLIFDEIDTGISGRTAYKTAEKLAAIAKKKQIICITHLAQIASVADTHFIIKKETDNQSTRTNVLSLDREGRKAELARIIGGAEITELTLKNAEEMLKLAEKK